MKIKKNGRADALSFVVFLPLVLGTFPFSLQTPEPRGRDLDGLHLRDHFSLLAFELDGHGHPQKKVRLGLAQALRDGFSPTFLSFRNLLCLCLLHFRLTFLILVGDETGSMLGYFSHDWTSVRG